MFRRLLSVLILGWAMAWVPCPPFIKESGIVNDLGLLSDLVSWNGGYEEVQGVCGEYHLLAQTEGIYDTRMRVYEKSPEERVVVFRPTQQTNTGGDIHVNRRLVPCCLFENCQGLVNDRFQQALLDLISRLPPQFIQNELQNRTVYLTGHSLGGSLQLLMAIYLWKQWDTLPELSLGLAGPFVGDQTFSDLYQSPMKQNLTDKWWQIESMNRYNNWEVDGTVEGYQVDQSPYLFIQQEAICRLPVDKLWDSYGMHDLRNYRTGLKGTNC